MRAAIYCRVSSAGQEDRYSLDTQETACRAFAQQRGLMVGSVAREVWSGGDRHRPALDALLQNLLPGDVVVAYALDRLSRSQIDTAILIDQFERAGATLALVTEDFEQSATGTFLRSAKAFVAELEREKIRERTQRGRLARAKSGKPIAGSRPPYGYQWVDKEKTRLMLDDATAPIVRGMFDMALAGASLRAIAANLNARGVTTPYGHETWSASTVRRILLRETYSTGDRVAYAIRFERQVDGRYKERPGRDDELVAIEGVAPPLVTPEEQAAITARLAANKQFARRNNPNPAMTLLRAGYLRCGHCGRALHVRTARANGYQYCCARRSGCPGAAIAAHIIDNAVWTKVVEVLRDPQIIATEVAKHRQDGGLEQDLASIEKILHGINSKQSRTAKAIAVVDDEGAAAPLIAELKTLSSQKAAAEQERDALRQRLADREAEVARVKTLTEW